MIIYSKQSLIRRLLEIRAMGWIRNQRPGNVGGIGNTIEDLLGIDENNLPLPNAGEWEIKCQRIGGKALTTLFHMEPSPRAVRFVPQVLLPHYGWPHQSIPGEQSFRQTINAVSRTDRGFGVLVGREVGKVLVSFDGAQVAPRHAEWLVQVERGVGLSELDPQPYWGFQNLADKAGTKLLNTFYVEAERERREGVEYFRYSRISTLEDFDFERFLEALEQGHVLIDFDARTGHNHGTKFRTRSDQLPSLYRGGVRIA